LLTSVWNAVRAFSPDGRALILLGGAAVAAGLALILLASFTYRTTEDDLKVIDRVAMLRARPAANAPVAAQVAQGDIVAPIAIKEGWYQVRTKSGETGWIWKNFVEQHQVRSRVFVYRVTGLELLLLAGGLLFGLGILRKRKAGSAIPAVRRENA
jgi:hypothetical protein